MGTRGTRLSAEFGLMVACLAACRAGEATRGRESLPDSLPPGSYASGTEAPIVVDALARPELIRRTRVRTASVAPVEQADLAREPGDSLPGPFVACKFRLSDPTGTTPKFDCVLPEGEVLKVKYGGNPEIVAEAAATRLLSALGFGADRVAIVAKLRCFGCPREPYYVTKAVDRVGVAERYAAGLDYGSYVDFEWVSAERKHPGRTIVAGEEGWTWRELAGVDERSGGSTRAELDALRLLAVLLAHWDNKPKNQRLVCLDRTPAGPGCSTPFAVVQDVGATFGPLKADLDRWKATPVWADPGGCRVSMKGLPYDGGTFPDAVISEPGRALLADQLVRLSRSQVETLFTAARFPELPLLHSPRRAGDWADAFEAKVREIAGRNCDGRGAPANAPARARR